MSPNIKVYIIILDTCIFDIKPKMHPSLMSSLLKENILYGTETSIAIYVICLNRYRAFILVMLTNESKHGHRSTF